MHFFVENSSVKQVEEIPSLIADAFWVIGLETESSQASKKILVALILECIAKNVVDPSVRFVNYFGVILE